MTTADKTLLAFNRGVISPRGLARIDLERMGMSAEIQSNFVPRVLGSMMLRPGLEYIDNPRQNFPSRLLSFTFGVDDTAQLELGNATMRVRIDDVLIERPAVATTVLNPDFLVAVPDANWTDVSDPGGTATHDGTTFAQVYGDGTDFGRFQQIVTVAAPDQGVEHALSVFVTDGPVLFKVGSTAGDDDLYQERRLDSGFHSLSFTPLGAAFTIQFANEREFIAWVDQIDIEPAGPMLLITPWASSLLKFLRWDQSGDIIYTACKNVPGQPTSAEPQQKLERSGDGRSWGVARYQPEDGPFRVQNVSGVTLDVSALVGDVTLHASQPVFKQEHADNRSLWRIASQGQTVTASQSADNGTATDSVRVVGSLTARTIGLIIEGVFVGTVHLQFSFDDSTWFDQGTTWTAPVSVNFTDGQDGQIIYYRLIQKVGNWTSGTVTMTINYTGGSIQGIARARIFTDEQNMNVQVLKDFGSIDPSKDWWEGEWSDYRGFPTAVTLLEGRLWWAGLDKIWGSISDAYESFDDNQEGDAGPISRTIGQGPIKVIHWLISMGRLLLGTSDNSANVAAARIDGNQPLGVRSNSFDEPLSPTNFNIKPVSSKGVFVDRTEQRLYELNFNPQNQDYTSLDLSAFTPDFNSEGIIQIAVQMKPDVRVHCVRNDGTVGMLVFDRLENVICWCEVDVISSTNGTEKVIDVSVLPGVEEDQVYYIVSRRQGVPLEMHIVKWAKESEAIGGQLNKMADSFVTYEGAPTTTPFTTELEHLNGETVIIWADGRDVGTDVVTVAGALTNPLAVAASNVVAGMDYKARFKSAKLGEITGIGLLERKYVERIGFIAENLHYQGLQYGPDFDNLYDLPQVEQGQVTPADTVHAEYHEDNFSFGGEWKTDSRICLQATAPRPCTILAALAEFKSVEKSSQDVRQRRS